ncbi:MAG TPA: hypothetical protein VK437_14100, partial [Steroidobacteraceae bacterium]|nr:hypothetical protein [Steroidobacteraceae bacterium]
KPNDFAALPASAPDGAQASAPARSDDSPYHHVYYLSAAGAAEPALEIGGDRTYDGEVHGAFTDAMLRVLTRRSPHSESHPGSMSYDELADAVEDFMRPRAYGHTPVRMPGRYAADRAVAEHPAFEWVSGAPLAVAGNRPQAPAGVRVRLDASARFLEPSLEQIPGVSLAAAGENDAEYLIRAANRGEAGQVIVTTPGNEPIYGSGGLDGAYPQDARSVVHSLTLRGSLRRLFQASEAQRGGLSLRAGFTDDAIGETVAAHNPVSLFAQVSAPAQVLVLHLMGDGSTHVWLAANVRNPECMQGLDLQPGQGHVLCQWGGAEAPYGLDMLYVVAFSPAIRADLASPGSTFDAGFVDRLTAAAKAAPDRVAVREVRFYTVSKKYN